MSVVARWEGHRSDDMVEASGGRGTTTVEMKLQWCTEPRKGSTGKSLVWRSHRVDYGGRRMTVADGGW